MRRFADDALLDDRAQHGGLDEALILRLAEVVRAFHDAAETLPNAAGARRLAAVVGGNAARFAACGAFFDAGEVAALLALQRAELARHARMLDARGRAGHVRHCHGDLHLANIALIDGEPVPFDCLEFDDELATTDILYDLAFLLMDLWHRGLRAAANSLFNRYLDLSAEEEDGEALMPLFLSIRAAIRAHVSATRAMEGGGVEAVAEAHGYLALAQALLEPASPLLVAIGGRSGTGKSTLARALAGDIGQAPGARILRSDVLRKRLAGRPIAERIPAADYTVEASASVYSALERACLERLREGSGVVADAAFLDPRERVAIAAVANAAGVDFVGLWLEAGLERRIARVSSRSGDASDADARVVRLQTRRPLGALKGWRRVRATGALGQVVAAARRALSTRA